MVIAAYDSGVSSFPVPIAIAESCTSSMLVVWMAPWVMVHDGFQKVDSS